MINNIRIVAAAAMACASLASHAQAPEYETPPTNRRFGIQVGSLHDGKSEPVAQIGVGYRVDPTWTVEALGIINLLFMRDGATNSGPFEFDHAFGARLVAGMPLTERWDLRAGVGVMSVSELRGLDIHGDRRDRTDAMLSLATMCRMTRHWSMGAEVSTLARTHAVNVGLRGEVHF
jgi:hypothetical protein